ncbi:MAG: hypothetical protein RLZZ230_732, partial [Candidatus Parcubacteria bacterium]
NLSNNYKNNYHVSELQPESVVDIVEFEKNIYKEVPRRIKGHVKMKAFIQASVRSANFEKRPSLSYEYRNKNNVLEGFVLSLIGDAKNTNGPTYVEALKKICCTDTQCIYVCDWSTYGANHIGGLFLRRFFQDYTFFLSKMVMIPVIA